MNSAQIKSAQYLLSALGMPRAQQNERSALCLLALLHLRPDLGWASAQAPLMGVTPLMAYIATHYDKRYAPNTRETFRRETLHQLVEAGLVLYNPDDPSRPVNSPKAVYQLAPEVLELIRHYETPAWAPKLASYIEKHPPLTAIHASPRSFARVSVQIADGSDISLSPGEHNVLIKSIIEEFAPRFTPGARLVYLGDTGNKWAYADTGLIQSLGLMLDFHGKMPDVILYDTSRNWLIIIESVVSHGPVNASRRFELHTIFSQASAGLVFVTAFPTRLLMARYVAEIAWETEVWTADAPSHLIHFNGDRFLGPYPDNADT